MRINLDDDAAADTTNRELVERVLAEMQRVVSDAAQTLQGIIDHKCFAEPSPAEPPEPAEASPERPEPKFVEGQWVNWWDEDNDTGTARIAAEPEWNDGEWLYTAEVVADATGPLGEPYTHVLGERTNTLSTHTMTLYDVPPETMHAILHGQLVRVVEHPVDRDGVPFSEPEFPGTVFTITTLADLNTGGGHVFARTSGYVWLYPWNLEVAED